MQRLQGLWLPKGVNIGGLVPLIDPPLKMRKGVTTGGRIHFNPLNGSIGEEPQTEVSGLKDVEGVSESEALIS